MKKIIKQVFLFLSVVFLFTSCGDSNGEVHQFNYEDEGGTELQLQIPLDNFIHNQLNEYTDPKLKQLLQEPCDKATTTPKDCIDNFCDAATNIDYEISKYFSKANPDEFDQGTSNDEMKSILLDKYHKALEACLTSLNVRLDESDWVYNLFIKDSRIVAQFNPAVKAENARRLVSGYVKIGFYNCIDASEGYTCIQQLEKDIGIGNDTSASNIDVNKKYPISVLLSPNANQDTNGSFRINRGAPEIGYCKVDDTSSLNKILLKPEYQDYFPEDVHFAWGKLINDENLDGDHVYLYMLTKPEPAMLIKPNDIASAEAVENDFGWSVNVTFKESGGDKWAALTRHSIGEPIAIFYDNVVVSCPVVQEEMLGGEAMISGLFDENEAKDLAAIINAARIPYLLNIIEEN